MFGGIAFGWVPPAQVPAAARTVQGAVTQTFTLGISTAGTVTGHLVSGQIQQTFVLGISTTGPLPEWFNPETTKSWRHLLRESKDPGGDVNPDSNRWLRGPTKKRRPVSTGRPSGE